MQNIKSLASYLIALVFFLCFAGAAIAVDDTITMQVTSRVVGGSCTISANNALGGKYDGRDKKFSTAIYVTCSKGTEFGIGIGSDADESSSIPDGEHRLYDESENNILKLETYQDQRRSLPWGAKGGNIITSTSNGRKQEFKVYCLLGRDQELPLGKYQGQMRVYLMVGGNSSKVDENIPYQFSVNINAQADVVERVAETSN